MTKMKIFLAKYGFWLVVGGIIVGVYGYGMWFRYNTLNNIEKIVTTLIGKEWWVQLSGIDDHIIDLFQRCFTSSEAFTEFKNSEVYALMTVPQKLQFNLAFQTKKTMPLAIAAIVLIALVMRTKFSATVDLYAAERQAALDEIRNDIPVEVEARIIDVPEETVSIETKQPLIESKEDNSDGMDIF